MTENEVFSELEELYHLAKQKDTFATAASILELIGKQKCLFQDPKSDEETSPDTHVQEDDNNVLLPTHKTAWEYSLEDLYLLTKSLKLKRLTTLLESYFKKKKLVDDHTKNLIDPNFIPGLNGKPFPEVALDMQIYLGKKDTTTVKNFLETRSITPTVFAWDGKLRKVPIDSKTTQNTKPELKENLCL